MTENKTILDVVLTQKCGERISNSVFTNTREWVIDMIEDYKERGFESHCVFFGDKTINIYLIGLIKDRKTIIKGTSTIHLQNSNRNERINQTTN